MSKEGAITTGNTIDARKTEEKFTQAFEIALYSDRERLKSILQSV